MNMPLVFGAMEYDQKNAADIGVASLARKSSHISRGMGITMYKAAEYDHSHVQEHIDQYWYTSEDIRPRIFRAVLQADMPPSTRTNVTGAPAETSQG